MSEVSPDYLAKATRVVSECLREEYRCSGVTGPSQSVPYWESDRPSSSWIGGMPILSFLLLPMAAGIYLFIR
jgi:hypothetical protein